MNFGDFGIFEDFWENFERNSEEFYGEWYRDFEGFALIMDDIDFNAPVIDRKLGNICSSSFRGSEFSNRPATIFIKNWISVWNAHIPFWCDLSLIDSNWKWAVILQYALDYMEWPSDKAYQEKCHIQIPKKTFWTLFKMVAWTWKKTSGTAQTPRMAN